MSKTIRPRAPRGGALAGATIAVLSAFGAGAQSPSAPSAGTSLVGRWRGTSVCLVRPSPCHDEIVVYRISRAASPDSLVLDARKIVRGREEAMGVLTCHVAAPAGPLTCAMPRGTWRFAIRRDTLVGDLRLVDGTRFRDVRVVRVARSPLG